MINALPSNWMDSTPWQQSIIRVNSFVYEIAWRVSSGSINFTIFHRKWDRIRIVNPGLANFKIQLEPHSSKHSTMRVESSEKSIIQAQLSVFSDDWVGVDGYASGISPLVLVLC